MPPTADQVRQQFIDFFVRQCGHTFVPSSPVVPHDDPTLLFTNAGMNQFKPIFLGQVDPRDERARLKRAINTQKCIRAGGKHNDLDDVGKDTYHHTFFEMLGNWSFGDYFKAEAIEWAWRLLVDVWKVDPSRLYATYFGGGEGVEADAEAQRLWQRFLPAERVLPGSFKDNFWEMGDTGPCGPCSEIHYDGRSAGAIKAGKPGRDLVNTGDPEVIEIWNLVFIQFNRTADGLRPLPAKHVDTGMGFERIVRVLQGKNSNYDTDVFTPLFGAIRKVCKAPDYTGSLTSPADIAYRVIADHIRTVTFAITDGAEPGNEGRNYVLRRILRRAVRMGRQALGVRGAFMCELVPTVVESFGHAFPELRKDSARAYRVIREEEEAFGRTLDKGIALFVEAAERGAGTVGAEDAFKLHDTYGFPIDLTQVMAEERGLRVDVAGFERLMEEAREKARAGGRSEAAHPAAGLTTDAVARLHALSVKPTDDGAKFADPSRPMSATVAAIWNGHDFDEHVVASQTRPTDRFAVILDRTNFYAEMGGQVGDAGRLRVTREARSASRNTGDAGEFGVEETRVFGGFVVHFGRALKGEVRVGDTIECRLDKPRRRAIMANHTATHLLNWALREALGDKVEQKGSLVAPERLRFDFSHGGAMTAEEVGAAQSQVREMIERDMAVHAEPAPLADAKRIRGVRAVFGEVYPDPVRVVSIGAPVANLLENPGDEKWRRYSVEFCGGTHLARTSEAGAFALTEESAVAKGVRRVEALTGEAAARAVEVGIGMLGRLQRAAELPDDRLAEEVRAVEADLESFVMPLTDKRTAREALGALHERLKSARKQSAAAGRSAAVDEARALAESAGGPFVVAEVKSAGDREALLAAMDVVRARRADAAALLAGVDAAQGKVVIVASVPAALIERGLKAGDWVREASAACGGKGGGRPDSAQGGGNDASALPRALEAARTFAEARLGAQV